MVINYELLTFLYYLFVTIYYLLPIINCLLIVADRWLLDLVTITDELWIDRWRLEIVST